jgi:hypothetical protein
MTMKIAENCKGKSKTQIWSISSYKGCGYMTKEKIGIKAQKYKIWRKTLGGVMKKNFRSYTTCILIYR